MNKEKNEKNEDIRKSVLIVYISVALGTRKVEFVNNHEMLFNRL